MGLSCGVGEGLRAQGVLRKLIDGLIALKGGGRRSGGQQSGQERGGEQDGENFFHQEFLSGGREPRLGAAGER